MAAQPLPNPTPDKGSAAPPGRRRRVAPSPYDAPGALHTGHEVIELPPGATAFVDMPPASGEFIGGLFSMDSLAFLRWSCRYFRHDLVGLLILVYLIGSQEVGGTIKLTQQQLADELEVSRQHVNRFMVKLGELGVVWRQQRGVYRLNPAAALRGGTVAVEPVPGFRTPRKGLRVDQRALMEELRQMGDVPESFIQLMLPEPDLPEPPLARPRRGRSKNAQAEEA
ncbi:helix-turn-helix domain-containing protein [Streptacidiphilus anmyonensis]|uniref:helix-turn-helix domain-containing protein n=1 Tax=Streptacidiphilus anmyonensis TaxID=405782 RepID=UPI0005AABB9E|nr:helix-turn-helix domain-containing protein [Streptacidiphilus anmyonensis]